MDTPQHDANLSIATSKHLCATANKFLVAGLARNCSKRIKRDISILRSATNCFVGTHWLVIESDSDDDTVENLSELSAEISNFRYLSLGRLRERFPLRTERIAYCRNKYLEELENNPTYSKIEFLIVVDLDGLSDSITEHALLSCWARDDWDVCTANQRGPYYDVSALRHRDWSPNNCWSQYSFLIRQNLDRRRAMQIAIYSRMITISESAEWIEVDSAFGGLAVYRRIAITGARYVGVDPDGDQVCEHVTFNAELRHKGKRILINPRLINAGYTEHTASLAPGLMRTIKRFFIRVVVSSSSSDTLDKLKIYFGR